MNFFQSKAEIIGLKQVEVIPLQKQFGKNLFQIDRNNGFFRMVWNILQGTYVYHAYYRLCTLFCFG